jgi:hypothetical protein
MKGTFQERPAKPKPEGEPKKKKKKESKQQQVVTPGSFGGQASYGYPAIGGAGVPEETNEMMLSMLFTQYEFSFQTFIRKIYLIIVL